MAAPTALVLNGRIETARTLNGELQRCTQKLEEVRERILGRAAPEDIRRQFRACQDAMMSLGRLLLSHGQLRDGRFAPRLPAHVRNKALDMLREGAAPVTVRRKLGLTGVTVQNLRRRDLGDHRNLLHACKLSPEQVAEIRKAGNGTLRRVFAERFHVSVDVVSRARNGRGSYREVTKVPPLQSTQAKRRPGPATTNELSLRLNAELARSLAEMAQLAHCEVATYATELLETGVAEFRAKKIPATFLDWDATMPLTAADADVKPRGRFRGRFTVAERERIHAQQDAGGLNPNEIARRWGCSATTIRRALDCD